jgi:hypothetical protein
MADISIVYALGKGSRLNNIEIRYSLRSLEQHLTVIKDVWVIGEKPDFLTNINHIPQNDTHDVPDSNIMLKIKKACETPKITDQFLFVNDDHYLLADFQADKFPYFYSQTIQEYQKTRTMDGYRHRCNNTQKSLLSRDLPTKYFDIHYPILYDKKAFLENVVQHYDLTEKHGFILKSLYANAMKIEGTFARDYKLQSVPPKQCQVFSTYPKPNASIYRFLEYKFPKSSKFEL